MPSCCVYGGRPICCASKPSYYSVSLQCTKGTWFVSYLFNFSMLKQHRLSEKTMIIRPVSTKKQQLGRKRRWSIVTVSLEHHHQCDSLLRQSMSIWCICISVQLLYCINIFVDYAIIIFLGRESWWCWCWTPRSLTQLAGKIQYDLAC